MIYFDGDSALFSTQKTTKCFSVISSVFVFRTGDQNWQEEKLTARKHSRTVWHWSFSELEIRLVIVINPTTSRCLPNWRSPLAMERIPIFKLFRSTCVLLENIFLLFRSGNTRPPFRNKPALIHTWYWPTFIFLFTLDACRIRYAIQLGGRGNFEWFGNKLKSLLLRSQSRPAFVIQVSDNEY